MRVFDRVDQGDPVPAGRRDGPELVQGGDRGTADLAEALVELFLIHPELLGDLLVGRRPAELRLQAADRSLDVPRPRAHRTGHPVHRPQLVDDRPLDSRERVGLELDVAVGVVTLDRADQAEQPVLDEVALVDVAWQPAADPAGHVLDERRVGEDQALA